MLFALRAERERRRATSVSRFSQWRDDPVGFVEDALLGFLWSKQKAICESVRDHRFTAVKSCHDVGKTAVAGRIGAWWLSVHEPGEAFLVTSAPTRDQVRALLWREINSVHRAGGLPGRTNQTEWVFDPNELVGFGRSVRDTDPTAFQGIHARRVLVIFDEACGISRSIWDAAETLVANEESRFLAIGNPDDPASEFARTCRPGSGYNVIRISAFDSPNFTQEKVPDWLRPLLIGKTWVEERRHKWGESSPLWVSKVTGEFPEQSSDGLVPLTTLRAAVDRELEPGEPNELGVDVARFGLNWTTIYHRRGSVARRLKRVQNRDLMTVTGLVVEALRETGATAVKIDDIGVGGGVTDRLRELRSEGKISARVAPINVAESCRTEDATERFINLRAELNWGLRERFVDGRIDIGDDEELLAQAGEIKYAHSSNGRIKIESKEDMQKRGAPSPDDWDALVLAYAPAELAGDVAFPQQESDLLCDPLPRIPSHWPRCFALDLDRKRLGVVWAAWDRANDIVYLYGEYGVPRADLAIHANAIMERGKWIPGVLHTKGRGRTKDEGVRLAERFAATLNVYTVDHDDEAAIEEVTARLSSGRLKVFNTLPGWLHEYRNFRRGPDQELIEGKDHLIRATALLFSSGLQVAMTEGAATMEYDEDEQQTTRNATTGY